MSPTTSPHPLVSHRGDTPAATNPVRLTPTLTVGGPTLTVIAGPCAIEGRDMLLTSAHAVRSAGAVMLRGGAYKPRTSPYAFQGMGEEGLALLAEAREVTGLPVVTEVMDARQIEGIVEHADMLQVGARNMQNFTLLTELGRCGKPVLLKRGVSARISELLLAAEYVMAHGNSAVVLCERGIRTFETATRNTLDVSAIPVLKRETHLPVIVDPSHAAGRAELVLPLALSAIAAGADGLIVEVHPDPVHATSDADQQLTFVQFNQLMRRVATLASALGRSLPLPADTRHDDLLAVARETAARPGMARAATSTATSTSWRQAASV